MICKYLALLVTAVCLATVAYGAESNPDFVRGDSLYQHGKGNPESFPEALESFKAAAAGGSNEARFLIGRMYHFGDGVQVDLAKAEHWYRLAAQENHPSAWNNLGSVLGNIGRGGEVVLDCFKRSSELGSGRGSNNVGRLRNFGLCGAKKDWKEARIYYLKALEQNPDDRESWSRLGRMYEQGGFGIKQDLVAAEEAYLKAAEVSKDEQGYYNLYRLYSQGKRPSKPGRADYCYEQAAELGNIAAAHYLGSHYEYGNPKRRDMVRAVHFYEICAKQNHGGYITKLNQLADDPRLFDHYGEETRKEWKKRYERFFAANMKEGKDDLGKIRRTYLAEGAAEARRDLDAALKSWKGATPDEYFFYQATAVWKEGQVASGRNDPAWACFLFDWLCGVYEANELSNNILGARVNLNSSLIELGRFASLRESCEKVKRMALELEGVDFDAVRSGVRLGPGYEIPAAVEMPLRVNVELAKRSQRIPYIWGAKEGEWIGGQTLFGFRNHAYERLMVGDWETSLFVAEWMERWVSAVSKSGMTMPQRSYPGCLWDLEEAAMKVRSDVFAALGLPEKEEAALKAVIKMNYQKSYSARNWLIAQQQLAGLRIRQGRSAEVDIEKLLRIEARLRSNRHVASHEWQFTKLVRARIAAIRNVKNDGVALVREVLEDARKNKRPLLRQEALITLATIELDAGRLGKVPKLLEEALGWARGNGHLLDELRIYELYVRYLCVTGDYEQALEMHRRVIDLINALSLAPRREAALKLFGDITDLQRKSLLAGGKASGEPSPEPDTPPQNSGSDPGQDTGEKPSEGGITWKILDLQPIGIRSLPSRDQAEGIFILSYSNLDKTSLTLEISSPSMTLSTTEVDGSQIEVDCSPGGVPSALTIPLQIEREGQLPVILSADNLGGLKGEASVTLQIRGKGVDVPLPCEWLISPDGNEKQITVIDAVRLRNNAFLLATVYHHLSSPTGRSASVAMRAIASEPTRIEGFATDGTLLFVDAEGNGSFGDSGDLIASDRMDALFPLLAVGKEDATIALRYQPVSRGANGRVEIRIQTREQESGEGWGDYVVDWLEP